MLIVVYESSVTGKDVGACPLDHLLKEAQLIYAALIVVSACLLRA